ncbi:Translocation protein S66 [Entomophthora muscae]|uniref:Translocation protein S66 n=1 Tax=Entomophthora muscae TaxID=34485 RepID=A0ACC2T305_9FUNG|nr:Translocation protein S66 [Entomophthora muscae]
MGYGLVTTYLVGWIVVFGSFVFFYHRNKALAASKIEPWFKECKSKELYIKLLQVDPPVDEHLLKAALLRRAMAVVERVLKMREQKPPLTTLLKNGSIGEEVWNSFCLAESALEEEVIEVMQEADTFNEGWGQTIYQTASEMFGHERSRAHQIEVERLRVNEREANKKIVAWKKEMDASLKQDEEKNSKEMADKLIAEEKTTVRSRKNKS